jgi:hypothetical protein
MPNSQNGGGLQVTGPTFRTLTAGPWPLSAPDCASRRQHMSAYRRAEVLTVCHSSVRPGAASSLAVLITGSVHNLDNSLAR